MVGVIRFELMTSSVCRKRSPPEPNAHFFRAPQRENVYYALSPFGASIIFNFFRRCMANAPSFPYDLEKRERDILYQKNVRQCT